MGIINLSTGRATIPLAGWWDICGHASASLNNNPEQFELNLYKNAVLHKSGGRVMVRGGVGADVHSATLATCVRLVSGDVVDLRVDHITGGNAIALSTGVQHNWLSVSLKEAI